MCRLIATPSISAARARQAVVVGVLLLASPRNNSHRVTPAPRTHLLRTTIDKVPAQHSVRTGASM